MKTINRLPRGAKASPLSASKSIIVNAPHSSSEQAARSRSFYILATALAAAIGAFFLGFDGSIGNAALSYLTDYFHLTPGQQGFFQGSSLLGLMVGPLFGGWFCDRIGREKTMLLGASMMGITALGTSLVSSLTVFIALRIGIGLGAGLIAIASPMYIAEVAPPAIRGRIGLCYQLAIVIGSTVAPFCALPFSYMAESHPGHPAIISANLCWRLMLASQLVIMPPLLYFISLLPPSPRWLADKGRFDEALDVLKKVHEPHLAELELAEIKGAVKEEEGGWSELWQPGIRFALLIGICLAFFNNWTGWSAMGGYITVLVKMSGVALNSSAILDYAITYSVMSVVTIISMFMVDRLGRRPLWNFASFMMAAVTLATGFVFYYHVSGWPVLLVLCLCTVPHGIALGGLPWLMMSELYPNRIRAKAVALNTAFLFTVIYSCNQLFPIFVSWSLNWVGSPAIVFWFFTFVCLLAALFGLTIMPETKGRTLEDISRSMARH
jgi:SP family arabinose:H+ symporter-like MFS transporter